MFTLTLNYEDGSTFNVGGFHNMDELNAWLANAQANPNWQASTTTTIVEIVSQPFGQV